MQKKFSRSFDEIARLVDVTEDFFAAEGIDPGLRTAVDLCIEELFVNMVTYNKETTSEILVEMSPIPGGTRSQPDGFRRRTVRSDRKQGGRHRCTAGATNPGRSGSLPGTQDGGFNSLRVP